MPEQMQSTRVLKLCIQVKWPSLVLPGAFLGVFGAFWRAGACVTVVTFRLLHKVQIDVRSTKCDTVVTFGV